MAFRFIGLLRELNLYIGGSMLHLTACKHHKGAYDTSFKMRYSDATDWTSCIAAAGLGPAVGKVAPSFAASPLLTRQLLCTAPLSFEEQS